MQEQSKSWEHEAKDQATELRELLNSVETAKKDIAQLKYNLGRMHEEVKDVKYLIRGEEGNGWLRLFLAVGMILIGFGSAMSVDGLDGRWPLLAIAIFAMGVVVLVWARHLARLTWIRWGRKSMKHRSKPRNFDEFDQTEWPGR